MSKSDLLVFLRFAFVCAEEKLRAKKITPRMFEELEKALKNSTPPSIYMLERCFPKAFEESLGFKTMAEYWHQHRGSGGSCAVKVATVLSVDTRNAVQVICDGEMLNAVNFYGLDLQGGDNVYLHRQVVIEKA